MSASGPYRPNPNPSPKFFTFSDEHLATHNAREAAREAAGAARALKENPFDIEAFSLATQEQKFIALRACLSVEPDIESLKKLKAFLESPAISEHRQEFKFFFEAIIRRPAGFSVKAINLLEKFLSTPAAFVGVKAEASGEVPGEMHPQKMDPKKMDPKDMPPAFQALFRLAFDESRRKGPGAGTSPTPGA